MLGTRELADYVLGETQEVFRQTLRNYLRILPPTARVYRYEDVVFNKRAWVQDIAEHLSIKVEPGKLDEIAEKHDILPTGEDVKAHIRSVVPGSFRRHLPPDVCRALTHQCSDVLEALGYDRVAFASAAQLRDRSAFDDSDPEPEVMDPADRLWWHNEGPPAIPAEEAEMKAPVNIGTAAAEGRHTDPSEDVVIEDAEPDSPEEFPEEPANEGGVSLVVHRSHTTCMGRSLAKSRLPQRVNIVMDKARLYWYLYRSGAFFYSYYLEKNPELLQLRQNPLKHYISIGDSTGRAPNPLFDPAWYRRRYPDVAGINTLYHYLTSGAAEGRDPSLFFSTSGYLSMNPDISIAKVNPMVHYLLCGAEEGRQIVAVE